MLRHVATICIFIFLCEHSTGQGTWTQKANFGGGNRHCPISFSIGSKGYIGFGASNVLSNYIFHNDLWEWNCATNSWTQKANCPGAPRYLASGFSIGNKAYAGTGNDWSMNYQDWWEWDQPTNTWTQKANFPPGGRNRTISFSIGTKGYVGTGDASGFYNDFWEYDPSADNWTQKANFGGTPRWHAIGFSIGVKGYIGTGADGTNYNDFWEWDQTTNTWTQKANFGGVPRIIPAGFSIGNKGYIGCGGDNSGNYYNDFWEWDQTTNTWTQVANFGGTNRWGTACFGILSKGYVGCGGQDPSPYLQDFWEYTPDNYNPFVVTLSGPDKICSGQTATLMASGGINYSWSTGASNNTITVAPSATTTYFVVVSSDCESDTANITVQVDQTGCSCKSEEFFLPNAFSPNNDNENDQFCVPQDPCFANFVLKIYDRWGEKVFESDNYQKCWDGTYKEKLLNTGAFVYYFNVILTDGSRKESSGNISLIR